MAIIMLANIEAPIKVTEILIDSCVLYTRRYRDNHLLLTVQVCAGPLSYFGFV